MSKRRNRSDRFNPVYHPALYEVSQAIMDETMRLNQAIQAGKKLTIDTAFGKYQVLGINGSMDARCSVNGDAFYTRTFCLCNDKQWSDLLTQAGLSRNPYFMKVK